MENFYSFGIPSGLLKILKIPYVGPPGVGSIVVVVAWDDDLTREQESLRWDEMKIGDGIGPSFFSLSMYRTDRWGSRCMPLLSLSTSPVNSGTLLFLPDPGMCPILSSTSIPFGHIYLFCALNKRHEMHLTDIFYCARLGSWLRYPHAFLVPPCQPHAQWTRRIIKHGLRGSDQGDSIPSATTQSINDPFPEFLHETFRLRLLSSAFVRLRLSAALFIFFIFYFYPATTPLWVCAWFRRRMSA